MGSEHGAMPENPEAGGLDETERATVMEAATSIFANYGPASVTLKWIALASGIPVERLSTEWPTVDALLGTVLIDVASGVDAVALARGEGGPELQDEWWGRIEVYEQILARSLLDGANTARLQQTFPHMEHLVELYESVLGLDERSARYRVALGCALEWGWRLFGPHLRIACGLADETEAVAHAEVQTLQQRFARLPAVDPG